MVNIKAWMGVTGFFGMVSGVMASSNKLFMIGVILFGCAYFAKRECERK